MGDLRATESLCTAEDQSLERNEADTEAFVQQSPMELRRFVFVARVPNSGMGTHKFFGIVLSIVGRHRIEDSSGPVKAATETRASTALRFLQAAPLPIHADATSWEDGGLTRRVEEEEQPEEEKCTCQQDRSPWKACGGKRAEAQEMMRGHGSEWRVLEPRTVV